MSKEMKIAIVLAILGAIAITIIGAVLTASGFFGRLLFIAHQRVKASTSD